MSSPEADLEYPSTSVLEVLNTAVLLLDDELNLVYLNPAAENLFEISRRQVVGQSWPEVTRTEQPSVVRMLQALLAQQPFTERELELVTATGRRITVDRTVTPLTEGDLLLEITQVDRHLRIAHEEHLLTQQRAARDLMRGMAHEIKNPLGGLRGAAQLLESELSSLNSRNIRASSFGRLTGCETWSTGCWDRITCRKCGG